MSQYSKNEPQSIQEMFGSIAKNYDRANAIISMNMYKIWNNSLIEKAVASNQPKHYLDLCCGTGDIALGYLKKTDTRPKVYLLDFCEEMLKCAEAKASQMKLDHHDLHYLKADAQAIPLADQMIDCATISYGIRNVQDPARCIQDVYRVLKPGGVFGILELTKPTNPILGLLHSIYLKGILPILGKFAASNQAAYQYLCNSVQAFMPAKDLEALMRKAGFTDIKQKKHFGGIVTILTGKK